ncbi:DNA-binding CsgD family transcriptional regulator/sugar-specific transcriptional regulator TrmB [Kitasatospora sp. MAA4]|uniref:helix-turn-helix transcriptional regulator n=1 Tax=Kitasatospora sp. MAA4 TaxID=3035093 RepID=UPI0024734340|nr:LuxR family transcriptional regulator [Kitasatospora sp. MAA4]MDH6131089.1 DNA-binding CsgD family transcriptional regulator/sugar-specific transcriptional regulator TrmB [Kitasatospora sp. MAA4]
MFEGLGLSSLAESVYLAMLQHPDEDLDILARRLDVDHDQIRVALDELTGISLLQVFPGRPAPKAVRPEVGLSALVARQQAEMARRHQQIEEGTAALSILLAERAESRTTDTGAEPEADPDIERLSGIDAIRDRLGELARSCEWEASSFMPGGAQSEENLKASRLLDAEAIERGVRVRTVYQDSVRNHRPTLEYAQWLGGLGSEVRTTASLPLRMLIVDRRVAVVPLEAAEGGSAAIVISSVGVITALTALFNSVWRSATALGASRRRDDDGLSSQERQVLRLLAAGLTDEAIARHLGVSVRTARRVAADLHTRLGARSRFQAGAQAVSRAWITPDDLE